jgi:leucine dehydrogenase
MELLEWMTRLGHDRVVAVQDEPSGLRAWIAIHQPRFGRTYGGVRVWHYRHESEAVIDALRLSHAMTQKCVLAGIPGGGAKTVVLADHILNRPAAMKALGMHIDALHGVYRAGPDVGFTAEDQQILSETTQWLARFGDGQLRPAGEATAEGAEWAIRAALQHEGLGDLADVSVAIQGLGHVGRPLAERLLKAGVRVYASDLHEEQLKWAEDAGVTVVEPSAILSTDADVLVPAALGGVLHDLSIPKLRCQIVAPVANNTLAHEDHAEQLSEKGILYVPDFVMNSGALIEGAGFDAKKQLNWSQELRHIGETTTQVLDLSRRNQITTLQAAQDIAEDLLAKEFAGNQTESSEKLSS